MPLCWTLTLECGEDGLPQAALEEEAIELVLHVSGNYTLLGSAATGGRVYHRTDVRRESRFVDMLTEAGRSSLLDLRRIDDCERDPL